MNLVVANIALTEFPARADKVLYSTEQRLDRRLADLSIQLDEQIFHDLAAVDVVYVWRGDTPANLDEVVLHDWDTAYFPNGPLGSFYCSPEVFSILGKLYKLDYGRLNFINLEQDSNQLLTEKILFCLNRLGYKINVK